MCVIYSMVFVYVESMVNIDCTITVLSSFQKRSSLCFVRSEKYLWHMLLWIWFGFWMHKQRLATLDICYGVNCLFTVARTNIIGVNSYKNQNNIPCRWIIRNWLFFAIVYLDIRAKSICMVIFNICRQTDFCFGLTGYALNIQCL